MNCRVVRRDAIPLRFGCGDYSLQFVEDPIAQDTRAGKYKSRFFCSAGSSLSVLYYFIYWSVEGIVNDALATLLLRA